MSLKVLVRKNYLESCPSAYVFRSECSDLMEFERLLEHMSAKSGLQRAELGGTLRLFSAELLEQLVDGKAVKTPLGTFYPSVSGSMDDPEEGFRQDAELGRVLRLRFRPESTYERELAARARLVRGKASPPWAPLVSSLVEVKSGSAGVARPGALIRVSGDRLVFEEAKADEGVYLHGADGSVVKLGFFLERKAKSFVAELPADLAPGTYALVVRARGGRKDPAEGRFEGLELRRD